MLEWLKKWWKPAESSQKPHCGFCGVHACGRDCGRPAIHRCDSCWEKPGAIPIVAASARASNLLTPVDTDPVPAAPYLSWVKSPGEGGHYLRRQDLQLHRVRGIDITPGANQQAYAQQPFKTDTLAFKETWDTFNGKEMPKGLLDKLKSQCREYRQAAFAAAATEEALYPTSHILTGDVESLLIPAAERIQASLSPVKAPKDYFLLVGKSGSLRSRYDFASGDTFTTAVIPALGDSAVVCRGGYAESSLGACTSTAFTLIIHEHTFEKQEMPYDRKAEIRLLEKSCVVATCPASAVLIRGNPDA